MVCAAWPRLPGLRAPSMSTSARSARSRQPSGLGSAPPAGPGARERRACSCDCIWPIVVETVLLDTVWPQLVAQLCAWCNGHSLCVVHESAWRRRPDQTDPQRPHPHRMDKVAVLSPAAESGGGGGGGARAAARFVQGQASGRMATPASSAQARRGQWVEDSDGGCLKAADEGVSGAGHGVWDLSPLVSVTSGGGLAA